MLQEDRAEAQGHQPGSVLPNQWTIHLQNKISVTKTPHKKNKNTAQCANQEIQDVPRQEIESSDTRRFKVVLANVDLLCGKKGRNTTIPPGLIKHTTNVKQASNKQTTLLTNQNRWRVPGELLKDNLKIPFQAQALAKIREEGLRWAQMDCAWRQTRINTYFTTVQDSKPGPTNLPSIPKGAMAVWWMQCVFFFSAWGDDLWNDKTIKTSILHTCFHKDK